MDNQTPNKKEKFIMYVCLTCKTADDVWYDTKGDNMDEEIYHCLKCGYYFSVAVENSNYREVMIER